VGRVACPAAAADWAMVVATVSVADARARVTQRAVVHEHGRCRVAAWPGAAQVVRAPDSDPLPPARAVAVVVVDAEAAAGGVSPPLGAPLQRQRPGVVLGRDGACSKGA